MRPPAECKSRWDETLKHNSSLADLQRAVKFNGPNSPCVAGCRSVCWKVFLLFRNVNANNWSNDLHDSRSTYSALKDHYLQYIKHPEKLAELSVDPLTDDPESPWDALRRDEIVRAEILQDVRRLPDEPLYHQEEAQNLILDILFIYCKLNPDIGGYRQGMHELLAPIFTVVYQDALECGGSEMQSSLDTAMVEMLDVNFVEHDAFTLFSKLMEKAKSFYEMSILPEMGQSNAGSTEQSTIVEMSRRIHEEVLMRVDPELAQHLKAIEVLPQIFLIRWVRLLFGREFPFEQLLVLWDTMFAFDPDLNLVSLVCVAMLIRIRWTLLEADYSVALQLLLKYPAPQAPHGPHTFVDDAVYLKDHLNTIGGTNLILKYTGRAPTNNPANPRPTTPTFAGLNLRSRTLGARSPLASSARFIQNPGAVEALFQGAARNVIERGEKLGINQAVRDAMGEIRKNMQGLQDARHSARAGRDSTAGDNHSPFYSAVEMERRNRQLAAMLDEAITSLKSITANMPGGVKDAQAETVDMAAAKVQFVKVHLEDPTLSLAPEDETMEPPPPPVNALSFTSNKENVAPIVAVDRTMVTASTAPLETPSEEVERLDDPLSRPSAPHLPVRPQANNATVQPLATDNIGADDLMETDEPPSQQTNPAPATRPPVAAAAPARPTGPIPTRSTLAQSSFAWMLEPDQTNSSHDPFEPPSRRRASSRPSSSSKPSPGGAAQHRKRTSGSGAASRERNAFLFGEVVPSGEGADGGGGGGLGPLTSDEIFGLEPLRRALPKPKGL